MRNELRLIKSATSLSLPVRNGIGCKIWHLVHKRCCSVLRVPFMPPVSESRKHILMEALHHHYVRRDSTCTSEPLHAWNSLPGMHHGDNMGVENLSPENLAPNWVSMEPDNYYNHEAALRDSEHLLCTVASFCSMSNDSDHPRVAPCATMTDEDIVLTGGALVSEIFRNAPEMHAFYIVGLCCAHPTAIESHSTYKLKLGVVEIYQHHGVWDFRYGWERCFGHIQTSIDGELIDNGFIQRLANVMDWETFGKIRAKRFRSDSETHDIKKLRYQPATDLVQTAITF